MSATLTLNPQAEKKRKSTSLISKVLKENDKNVLRTIRFTFEWIKTVFESLKNFSPIKNLIHFIKGGEDTLSFNEFAQSLCNMGHTFTKAIKTNVIDSIIDLIRSGLDLIWNFFKICKSLYRYEIINFASKFYINLMTIGGISFAINSADKAYNISKYILNLEKNIQKRDALILLNLCKLARNIGTFAVGILTTSTALFGFVAPGMFMLLVGTTILASSIAESIISAKYEI